MLKNPQSRARLYAVQAYYAQLIDESTNQDVIVETLAITERKGRKKLLEHCKAILEFADSEGESIRQIIAKYSSKTKEVEDVNPLIQAILVVALAEIIKFEEIDKPLLISEYIKISYSFFDKPETSFINAILDNFVKSA